MSAAQCSYAMLGDLRPWGTAGGIACKNPVYGTKPSDLVSEYVSGIELPPNIMIELRMLGYPLMAYNRGELEDAINACSVDKVMLENPDAHNFRDKLKTKSRKKSPAKQAIHGQNDNERGHPYKKIDDDEDLFFSIN